MTVPESVWRQAVLNRDATIEEAISCLDMVALKIILVVNELGVLEGTISDGDIRRGLLRGLTLSSLVSTIVQTNALLVPPNLGREFIMQLMLTNKIQQIPIIDENRHVIGLHIWDQVSTPSIRSNLMVLMAGGLGMRLRPHTEKCPKPLLPISGKPILQHIIERAKSQGFVNFCIAVNYLGHMIEDHFGDGSSLGVKINYIREDKPLGTAGALSLFDAPPDNPFLVSNGDVLSDIRYDEILDFHFRYSADATMAIRLYEWQNPFGVVNTQGMKIIGFEEKPVIQSHINAGVYVLSPLVLQSLHRGECCDMPALFERIQVEGMLTIAYPMHEPWLDVGRIDDMEKANLSIR